MVGVDDEVLKFYRPAMLAASEGGEWVIRSDTNRQLWNSTAARRWRKQQKVGTPPAAFDVRNLQRFNTVTLLANIPARLPRMLARDFQPAHLNWAEAKLYCGPRAPYAPIINMVEPVLTFIAQPNEVVRFSASATYWDKRTPVPLQYWRWDINLIHCQGKLCHQHNPGQFRGVSSGTFRAEPHDDGTKGAQCG
jgi:hypothetical protein